MTARLSASPRLRVLLFFVLLAPAAFASATTAWEMNTYVDFIRGQFQGVSLSRDGRLTLAPRMDTLFSSDQAVVWSVAQGPNGVLYVATGHRGRVYQIDPGGKSSLLWTADQPEVFAIATDSKGILYAATSPEGKVYRIENGTATEYFAPKSRYIWSLAAGPDGALYVGTGDQGKIYRVESAGKGELYYDTGQSPVTGLAVDSGRTPPGRHRTERNLVSRNGERQSICAVRCQPARDSRHHSRGEWHRLCRRTGWLTRETRPARHAGIAEWCRRHRGAVRAHLHHRRSPEHRTRRGD